MKKNKLLRIVLVIVAFGVIVSACSKSETKASSRSNKSKKKTQTKEATTIERTLSSDEETTPAETESTVNTSNGQTYRLIDIEYTVPDDFSVLSCEENENQFSYEQGKCIMVINADTSIFDSSKAQSLTRKDFERYSEDLKQDISGGGEVLSFSIGETNDFWILDEKAMLPEENNMTFFSHVLIDRNTGVMYVFMVGLKDADETVMTNVTTLWNRVIGSIVKLGNTSQSDIDSRPTDASPSSSEEQTSPSESKTQEVSSKNVIVYEDSRVIIQFLKVDSKGVHLDVENLTDANITIQADAISINGHSVNDIIMSDDVAPKSIGEVVVRCSVDYKNPVGTISGQLRIIDFNKSFKTYDALFDSVVVDENITVEMPAHTGVLVYEDEKVRIYYKEITKRGITFEVENLTGVLITIQADSISINRRSVNDIIMSDDVAPHSIGDVVAMCTPNYEGNVESISGQLRIIDFGKSFKTYDASFVDVAVG